MKKEDKKKYFKEYHLKNKARKCAIAKAYYYANRKKVLEQRKSYRDAHHSELDMQNKRRYWKQWYSENKEREATRRKEYRKRNPKMFFLKYKKELHNPTLRTANLLRHRVRMALKAQNVLKTNKVLELLGVQNMHQVRNYLEKQFQPGMSWQNHGEWHIDHKVPVTSFNLSKLQEQKKAFHYTNLQPLWAKDNLSKGAKLSVK